MLDYQKISSLFSNFLKLTTGLVIFSPLLLMAYLNIFESTSFFPLLINETYILTNLVISAIIISAIITIIYIFPYYLFSFLQSTKRSTNKYYLEEEAFLNIKKNKAYEFKFSIMPFLIGLMVTSLIIYSTAKTNDSKNQIIILYITVISALTYYVIEIALKNCKKSFNLFNMSILIGILFSIFFFSIIISFSFLKIGKTNSLILSFMIVIVCYFAFSLKKSNLPSFDDKILILLTSLFITHLSLIICLIYLKKVKYTPFSLDDLASFIFYMILAILLPNYILSLKNKNLKITGIVLLASALLFFSNILGFVINETFSFMKLNSEEKTSVHIKATRDNTSFKKILNLNLDNVYVIYQTEQNTILCQENIFNKKPNLLELGFKKHKNLESNDNFISNESKCFLAKTADIVFK